MHSLHIHAGRSPAEYDTYPDSCPVCHHSAQIILVSDRPHLFPEEATDPEQFMQLLFRCPRRRCGTQFLVEYKRVYKGRWFYSLHKVYPMLPKKDLIAKGISAISPRFVEILQQATIADAHNLSEVSGIGYRKALEFLIKDYCIHKTPEKAADVRAQALSTCINNYVADANVKNCANRATWLGNDEAHYERVWAKHDLDDLKALIELTQHWISSELLTAHYVAQMDKRNPSGKSSDSPEAS